MGKNFKGGKKHKKFKNKEVSIRRKDVITKDWAQEYFIITKMLGDGRCLGNGSDGRFDVLLIIRGSMRKKVWIHVGDKVLGSYRDFSNGKIADIIHKYSETEYNSLQRIHKVKFLTKGCNNNINNNNNIFDEDNCGFRFDDL